MSCEREKLFSGNTLFLHLLPSRPHSPLLAPVYLDIGSSHFLMSNYCIMKKTGRKGSLSWFSELKVKKGEELARPVSIRLLWKVRPSLQYSDPRQPHPSFPFSLHNNSHNNVICSPFWDSKSCKSFLTLKSLFLARAEIIDFPTFFIPSLLHLFIRRSSSFLPSFFHPFFILRTLWLPSG